MSYNAVIGVEVLTDVTTEPVTLDQVKRHLNMKFDGGLDFDDDDTYLTELITECREIIERITGYSLAPKTLKATVINGEGSIEIPYGPVTSEVTIVDKDGEDFETDIRGNKVITCSNYLELTYDAGYETIPAGLKRTLLEEIAWRYNHRGDEVNIGENSRRLVKLYKKSGWLL